MIPAYLKALRMELAGYMPFAQPLGSLYFGGGTPSYLPTGLLAGLLSSILQVNGDAPREITLEANPGTLTQTSLSGLREAGFNRLSLGLQATQDELLATIGRIHTWRDFCISYELARQAGFDNIGVDLIFGLPGQTAEAWRDTLKMLVELAPEHISTYALQVEPGTPLETMVGSGRLRLPEEEATVAMFQTVMTYLPEHGYNHYEISNYARPGFESLHNLHYWLSGDYLGCGAGACSTFHGKRWTNIREPGRYIQSIEQGISTRIEEEKMTKSIVVAERVMLRLRLSRGLDLVEFRNDFGMDLVACAGNELELLMREGLLSICDNCLRLTAAGILVSNEVIARLLNVMEQAASG